MRNYFTFANKPSTDFGIYTNGRETFGSPAHSFETIQIPGRNGDILMDNRRFENVDLTYPASFIFEDFKNNIREFRNYVSSFRTYQRLIDTYNPDEYRMAIFKDVFEPEVADTHEFGQFDIVFHCKPQRFLLSGDETQSFTESPFTLTNPTLFDAEPTMVIYGYGTIDINGDIITIKEIAEGETVTIDFETMNAYYGVASRNSFIELETLDYPTLRPGVNNISFGGNITKIDIVPRWYRL